MRKIVTMMLLMVAAMTAWAQDNKNDALREKFFNARVDELVQKLEMNDEQKEKFIPVYRRYSEEMRSVMGPRMRGKKGPKAKGNDEKADKSQREPMTDEERLTHTKQRLERQQKAQTIRLKYIDEFAKVLTAKQVNKLYEAEDHIQKKLMNRRHHMKHGDDKGHKGDKDGKKKSERKKKD